MNHNIIFYYHSIGSDSMSVNESTFENSIKFLKKHYQIVPVSELIELQWNSRNQKGYCSISFDDCFQSVYQNAVPILKQHNIKATFYATINYIGTSLWGNKETNKWSQNKFDNFTNEYPMMTLEQLKLLVTMGHEIGCHTFSHRNLDDLDSKELQHEIGDSKIYLEHLLNCKISSFAYPRGIVNKDSSAVLGENNYANAVTTQKKYVYKSNDRYSICRYAGPNKVAAIKDITESAAKLPMKYIYRYIRNKIH